jgi:hypothetical protein
LASEIAATSDTVRQSKEAFERATWEYLKELEVLRYNPGDAQQNAKVVELAGIRRQRLNELSETVRVAIEKAVGEADQLLVELTVERERIEERIAALRRATAHVKLLASGDQHAKETEKKQIVTDLKKATEELDSLNNIVRSWSGNAAPEGPRATS